MRYLKSYLKIFGKTLLVFSTTLILLALLVLGTSAAIGKIKQARATARVPEKPANLPLVQDPVRRYNHTDQVWKVPHYSRYLSAGSWLSLSENCLYSCRLNEMKFVGMIPGSFEIEDFNRFFTTNELFGRLQIHQWSKTLDEKTLEEISVRLRSRGVGKSNHYRWVSISSMDELIYLAKRKHHVMVGVTIWLAPTRRHPLPRRYLDAPISHALTVKGIKSYDSLSGLITFETDDPLPFSWINDLPVRNHISSNGYGRFGRQAVPHLVPNGWAKSGYLVVNEKMEK